MKVTVRTADGVGNWDLLPPGPTLLGAQKGPQLVRANSFIVHTVKNARETASKLTASVKVHVTVNHNKKFRPLYPGTTCQ